MKEHMQRSQVLAHPLSGLTREIGASQKDGAVFDAWARALGDRQLWTRLPGSTARGTRYSAFTALVYDEATHNIVAGFRGFEQGNSISKM